MTYFALRKFYFRYDITSQTLEAVLLDSELAPKHLNNIHLRSYVRNISHDVTKILANNIDIGIRYLTQSVSLHYTGFMESIDSQSIYLNREI